VKFQPSARLARPAKVLWSASRSLMREDIPRDPPQFGAP
jgi:hypothetical protein